MTTFRHCAALTPSNDAADNGPRWARIYVGSISGGATATIVQTDGSSTAVAGLLAGHEYSLPGVRIAATGTTASAFVAIFE